MLCRILLCAVLLLLAVQPVQALTVEVVVNGVDGEMHDNVLADLGLYQHQYSPRLSEYDVRRLHRQAEQDISEALAPYGYYQAKVRGNLVRSGDDFYASYDIELGEPVLLRSVSIMLDGLQPQEAWFTRATADFPLQIGDILHQGKYEDGKKQLLRAALQQGFLGARFTLHELRINRRQLQAEAVLVLDTGPRYLFGPIDFSKGIIENDLLNGYLSFHQGDPYRPAKMVELQRALYRTDYFSTVRVEGRPEAMQDRQIPVSVDLRGQEKRNRYSFGVGYATDTGARSRLDWRNRLINSHGHTMKGSLQVGQYENDLSLTYDIPVGNPDNDKYAMTATYADQNWDSTDTTLYSLAGGIEHGGKLFRHGQSLEIRHEQYKIGVTEGEMTLLMPSLTGTWVDADDLLYPKRGIQVSVTASGALDGFGSTSSFAKVLGGGKLIFSPFTGWRLIGRGTLGAVLADSIDDLPPSLRFYAGGDTSIRGYGYKKLGTRDSSGAVVGGRYLVVGSIEVEKEINDKWALAAFWDAGDAMDDPAVDFAQGVGLGVRFRLPFGQVRVDIANAITEEDYPFRLHLSVGADL